MSNQHHYVMYQCQNEICRLRFPKPDNTQVLHSCPACGSSLSLVEESYANLKPNSTSPTGCRYSISVALDNLRSAYNVGAIFRTADAAGIKHIHLYGITPTPDNPKIQKTSLSAEFAVPWSHHKNGLDHIIANKENYHIWAVEGGRDSISIFDLPAVQTNRPLLLVFGSEYAGIDPSILRSAHQKIFIPMLGFKRSLNVSAAFAIVSYTICFASH